MKCSTQKLKYFNISNKNLFRFQDPKVKSPRGLELLTRLGVKSPIFNQISQIIFKTKNGWGYVLALRENLEIYLASVLYSN